MQKERRRKYTNTHTHRADQRKSYAKHKSKGTTQNIEKKRAKHGIFLKTEFFNICIYLNHLLH